MRPWLGLAAVVILLAACMGPSAPRETAAAASVGPSLRALVIDDEFAPIHGAKVFVEGNGTTRTTDASGVVELPLPVGPFVVKAWAPSYYRNLTQGDAQGNDSVQVQIVLQRRPADALKHAVETDEGLCALGISVVSQVTFGCLPSVECLSSCDGPRERVELHLPEAFRNLTARLSWQPGTLPQNLTFEVRLFPEVAFANGAVAFTLKGPSPILVQLEAGDLSSGVKLGESELRFTGMPPAWPPQGGTLPIVISQRFFMDAHVFQFYEAPPNPSWDE